MPPQPTRQNVPPLPLARGQRLNLQAYSESWYPRYHYGWSELVAVQDGRYKLIRAPRRELFDLRARLSALPGFGEMKVKALSAVLAKRFGVRAAEEIAPTHPTLGDVDSPEALEAYQAKKRAYKAKMRAERTA